MSGVKDHTDNTVLTDIRSIHAEFPMCGEQRNALLTISDDLLLYVISLLKNEIPELPDSSISQWHELIRILNSHRALPLIYWQIMHIPSASRPPQEIVDTLRMNFFESRFLYLLVDKQIRELVGSFDKADIRIIFLKGSALARTVYPDPATRPGSDIDILVLPDDLHRSRNIMERLGYTCDTKYFDISKNWYCEEIFVHKDHARNYLPVEIHWHLFNFSMIRSASEDRFFDRSVKIKVPGFSFNVLNPVDTIIHVSMHIGLSHNRDIRLIWIYDIFLLCRDLGLDDWKTLQKRSVEYGARISLERSLMMAQYWTGLKIPPEFADFTSWPDPTKNEALAISYVTQGANNPVSRLKLRWPKSASALEKIEILFYLIFPPAEGTIKKYGFRGHVLIIVSHVKRWFKLAKRISGNYIRL